MSGKSYKFEYLTLVFLVSLIFIRGGLLDLQEQRIAEEKRLIQVAKEAKEAKEQIEKTKEEIRVAEIKRAEDLAKYNSPEEKIKRAKEAEKEKAEKAERNRAKRAKECECARKCFKDYGFVRSCYKRCEFQDEVHYIISCVKHKP